MGCPNEVYLGDDLTFTVNTHDPETGEHADADFAPSYRVYADTTTPALLAGNLFKLDDANTTGFYAATLACTAANGFEARKTYSIYIEATVDSHPGTISYNFRVIDLPVSPVAAPTLADIRAGIITDHGVGSYQRESGVGIHTYVYTVTDAITGLPLDGVYVWVTLTNNASEDPPQASGHTIANGTVPLHLDPGWYYFWKQLAGWNAPTADYLEVS